MLKRFHHRLLLLLGTRSNTQIWGRRIGVSLFILCLSLLQVLGVSAQTDTPPPPTPTATLYSVFNTPTPLPTLSNACPTAMPLNWGTVTPGLMWMAECTRCLLTLTPQPSATLVPTQTPGGATATPSPTVTPTLSPIGIYYEPIVAGPLTAEATSPGNSNISVGSTGSFSRLSTGPIVALEYSYLAIFPSLDNAPASTAFVGVGVDGSYPILQGGTTLSHNVGGTTYPSPVIHIKPYSDGVWSTNGMPGNAGVWGSEAAYNSWLADRGRTVVNNFTVQTGSEFTLGLAANIAAFFESGPRTTIGSLQVTGIWYYGAPVDFSPTPEPATYCGDASGGSFGSSEADLGIELPRLARGAADTCINTPEVTIPLTLLNVMGFDFEDYFIPSLGICFYRVGFTPFEMLGVTVNPEMWFSLAVAVGMLRAWWRS